MLVSTLLGVLILGEAITNGHIFGILFLFIGIITISWELESEKSDIHNPSRFDYLFPLGAMFFIGMGVFFGRAGFSGETPTLVGLMIKFTTALTFLVVFFSIKGGSVL